MLNNEITKEVLLYWKTIEFLNQNDFPIIPRKNDDKRKKYAMQTILESIHSNTLSLDSIIKYNNLAQTHPEISSAIEICLGKTTRDECIQKIYQLTGNVDKRIEGTKGSIAIMGLQITSLKRYVGNSLNVSPIIWLLYKLHENQGSDIVSLINEAEYHKDIQEFENELKQKEEIDLNDLEDCYHKVCAKFFVNAPFNGIFAYQRFKDEATKEKSETVLGYSNLNMSFFAKDLDFICNAINDGTFDKDSDEALYLKSFIGYGYNNLHNKNNNRVNILENSPESIALYKKVMHINNAPIGKWPSKYSPSFMQQFAINLSVSKCLEEPMNYISVNGPPGTGKTTMLKEIIADSIVKKAIAMMKYEDSDHAFGKKKFKFGLKTNNGYHKWDTYNNYYSIDDEINKYSIVVASCNNAAVENITKELPDGEALCKGLECDDSVSDYDQSLNEVKELFASKSEDIYFTEYAKQIIDNDHYNWGMISVPLGNRKNQSDFIKVLNQFFFNELSKTSSLKEHKENYKASLHKFRTQLELVKKLKIEILDYCNLEPFLEIYVSNKDIELKTHTDTEKRLQDEIINFKNQNEINKEELQKKKLLSEDLESNYKLLQNNKLSKQQELVDLENAQEQERFKITELENRRNFKEIFLRLFHVDTMNEKMIRDAYIKFESYEEQIKDSTNEYEEILKKVQDKNDEILKLEKETLLISEKIEENLLKEQRNKEDIHSILNMKKNILVEIEQVKQKNLALKKEVSKGDDFHSFDGLYDDFWDEFYHDDIQINTKAHLRNPWSSEHYNREREKLFYLALQVIKEFTLSSFAIRTNVKNLLMMWTHNEGDETITYDERDRLAAFPSLLQSLSIFVPVISTTFASVNRFFEDYANTFTYGTLIIDEAGQAQPHMALGLLARCRKAIIVGDPKQVEPVVKDDLDAIKQLIKTEIRAPYTDKHLSVQEFADGLNRFGTIYKDEYNMTWVGCPLVVHRRCISPMFEIANELSYNNTMRQQTQNPSPEQEAKFVFPFSQWINISGKEKSSVMKNHYVLDQGQYVIKIVEKAFSLSKGKKPSLYIISPFTSVIDGIKSEIKASTFYKSHNNEEIDDFIDKNCGTVHTFQGKEANEVIFLLGCDRDAIPAIKWVNSNIINVAATRAKYRLCIVGEYSAWKNNKKMSIVKGIIDGFTVKKIEELNNQKPNQENKKMLEDLLNCLPSKETFLNEDQEFDANSNDFIKGLSIAGFDVEAINEENLSLLNITQEEFNELSIEVKGHLIAATKVDQIIRSVENNFHFKIQERSSNNILFCKAFERNFRDNFINGLKMHFGEDKTRSGIVQKLQDKDFMSGLIKDLLTKHLDECVKISNHNTYNSEWWITYLKNLKSTIKERNNCCHPSDFTYDNEIQFRNLMFAKRVFIDMKVGKLLEVNKVS